MDHYHVVSGEYCLESKWSLREAFLGYLKIWDHHCPTEKAYISLSKKPCWVFWASLCDMPKNGRRRGGADRDHLEVSVLGWWLACGGIEWSSRTSPLKQESRVEFWNCWWICIAGCEMSGATACQKGYYKNPALPGIFNASWCIQQTINWLMG